MLISVELMLNGAGLALVASARLTPASDALGQVGALLVMGLAAAEAKVDVKLKQLAGLKGDIQGLLGEADAKKEAELARLVTIYEQMKPADAAVRMTLLDDSVRLPLASKMNVRKLSAILGMMPPADAKTITEKLADRLSAADQARAALAQASAASAAAAKTAPAANKAGGTTKG